MANNVDILDAVGGTQTVKTTDTAGVHTPHHNVDSSALPTGAATAANQSTAAGILTTIDSDTGNIVTAIQLIDNAVSGAGFNITQFAGAAVPIGAGTEAAAVRVTIATDSTGLLSIDDNGGSLTVDGTFWQATQPVSIAASVTVVGTGTFVTQSVVTNAGTFAVQVDGAALTSLQLIDDAIVADDAGFTPATTKVMMVGFEADETATDSVDEGDGGAARMTLDRKVITTPQPHTAGGLSISRDIDLDNGTLTVVKNAAGQLYGFNIANRGTVPVYVKFYDAASGTLGTGTPVLTFEIPANASDHTIMMQNFGGHGLAFATGICVGAGTAIADADNTDPGANIVLANIFYK